MCYGRECKASANPRVAGCVRCGKALPEPEGYRRNPQAEGELVALCARQFNVDERFVESLNAYAEGRAEPGPVRLVNEDGSPRSLVDDFLEEMGDGANYAKWLIKAELEPAEDDDKLIRAMQALAHVAAAYELMLPLREHFPPKRSDG